MEEWIKSKGINGEYGYLNLKTEEFRRFIPKSNEAKKDEQNNHNQAVLKQQSEQKALHIPKEFPTGFNNIKRQSYFLSNNGSELAARGSQIKDYFKITDPYQEITPEQLKYAAKNYIKDTGIDNNMSEFFEGISNWEEAAKWLSKYASGVMVGSYLTTKGY